MKLTKLADITAFGKPEPAGSKRPFVPLHPKTKKPFYDKRGRIIVNVVDDNPNAKPWQQVVKAAARKVLGATKPVDCAVFAKVSFYVTRPKYHFRTGQFSHLLKRGAPKLPTKKPDSTKLWRCVEDALTGVVWVDDAQIVNQNVSKSYGPQAGVRVEVFRVEESRR